MLKINLIIFLAIGVNLITRKAMCETLPPISVGVSQISNSGNTRYLYQVTNKSNAPVTSIIIGYNYYSARPQLKTPPLGWSLKSGIPQSSVTSPNGWTATVVTTEESNLLQIEWSVSDPSSALAPGQTLQGFSVTLPKADDSYKSSRWTAYLNSKIKGVHSGSLTQMALCDYPQIAVSLSPTILWPPNHKMSTIQATITVQDDAFPNPAVKLESITSNETLQTSDVSAQIGTAATSFALKAERNGSDKSGRVYTIKYTATNSCGNSSSTTETVVVPHDQSDKAK